MQQRGDAGSRVKLFAVKEPPAGDEGGFLKVVIVHFHAGWGLVRTRTARSLGVLKRDVGQLFSLPLPRAVWQGGTDAQGPAFVSFVDGAVRRTGAGGVADFAEAVGSVIAGRGPSVVWAGQDRSDR